MAVSAVAKGGTFSSATAATTTPITLAGAGVPAVGDVMVVCVGTVNTAVSGVADNATGATNKYYQVGPTTLNTELVTVFVSTMTSITGLTTVTATHASSRRGSCCNVYTGAPQLSYPKGGATGAASPATITGTEVVSNAMQVGCFVNKGTATWSASTGTLRQNIAGAGTTTPGACMVDNTTTTTAAAESASNVWAGNCIELLPGTPQNNSLALMGCGI